jgi:nucleotide-binding universal stress UspA family protein
MSPEQMSSSPPLVVGIAPGQHAEVLQTAVALAARLETRLLCAYVDEASFLVDWDPARPAHRLSLHPDTDDPNIGAVALELKSAIEAAVAVVPPGTAAAEWTLQTLAGDPARALARLAAETDAPMIIVGTSERGFSHRLAEALSGSVGAWLTHHQSRPVLIVPYRMPAHDDRP